MGIISEFRTFAIKGNVIDLAIGVVIGAAFSKIVGSLIDDVITPLLLKPALDAAHLTNLKDLTVMGSVKYGNFISQIISYIIVAIVLFLVIKGINKMKKKEAESPSIPPEPTTKFQRRSPLFLFAPS